MRKFETGATRNSDDGKLDYEGFLSPQVLARFAQYMHQHRVQADGEIRDSDNWQKGIPRPAYMKSMFRHFMELWTLHREDRDGGLSHEEEIAIQEALCAIMFNAMGYLHEEVGMVGMHLPGQGDPKAELDLSAITLAPQPAETLADLDDVQVAPAHDPSREWDPDAGSFMVREDDDG